MAEDLLLISNSNDYEIFIYWLVEGDSQSIYEELQAALMTKKNEYELKNRAESLRWLIEKLNKHAQKNRSKTIDYL